MTYSICVHEPYRDATGAEQHRFGVAVTTRLPAVGSLCPFVSDAGAVATQSVANPELGSRGIEYVEDGLAIDDALRALLNADDGRAQRQVHGVDSDTTFTFSGDECPDWYGHASGENYTVAGNSLTGGGVVDAVAAAYEESDREESLVHRLIDVLGAGSAAGGDRRTDLSIGSAAVHVETTEARPAASHYSDLRVDATESPIADLRETYRLAKQGYEMAVERYTD